MPCPEEWVSLSASLVIVKNDFLHGSRVRNQARQDSDWDFLIIADHPLDREIITKLKDGLHDIELENDEVVSSIVRSRQEWSSLEYDALPFKKAVERGCRIVNYNKEIIRYRLECVEETCQEALLMQREKHWNTCASRLYYACFYAVSALLQQHDFSSGKHNGVKVFSISILGREKRLYVNFPFVSPKKNYSY